MKISIYEFRVGMDEDEFEDEDEDNNNGGIQTWRSEF